MTLNSGDVIACGTNHEGLGSLQDGETVEIEIQHIGKMSLKVADPLKRKWERGVYMGVDFDQPRSGQASPAANRVLRRQKGTTATGSDTERIASFRVEERNTGAGSA